MILLLFLLDQPNVAPRPQGRILHTLRLLTPHGFNDSVYSGSGIGLRGQTACWTGGGFGVGWHLPYSAPA
jgi:hypothetical protein